MDKRKVKELRNSIEMCKMRLNTIKPHLTQEKTALNESFNKLLIEKAILKDELKRKTDSFLACLIKKISGSKKELICDYFK